MVKCDNCPQKRPYLNKCLNINPPSFTREDLESDLLEAIKVFYKNDIELINRSANEVCITSHIFHYFSTLFYERYIPYNIDPEYNRNGIGAKYYCQGCYARPDLIIHKRNCNKFNLLYIEFKVGCYNYDDKDLKKITRFVSNEYGEEGGKSVMPYRYQYGVSIILRHYDIRMLWFKNGKKESVGESVYDVKTWRKIDG